MVVRSYVRWAMPTKPRFIVSLETSYYHEAATFVVPETWPTSPSLERNVSLRQAWRCVCRVRGGREELEEFLRSPSAPTDRSVLDVLVHVSASVGEATEPKYYALVIDLWADLTRAQGLNLHLAVEALKAALKQVMFQCSSFVYEVREPEQVYMSVRLPTRLARRLRTSDQAKVALRPHLPPDKFSQVATTVRLDGSQLTLGPEPPRTPTDVETWLSDETRDHTKYVIPESSPSRRRALFPIAMAAVLVGAWALPLRTWSVATLGAVVAVLITLALFPARKIGLGATLRQTSTIAALGLFWIAVFGIGYATCELLSPGSLGESVTKLGHPLLVATALGVAGGLVGNDNPTGAARILAHVELLLFLGGLVGVLAILLRIDMNVRRRDQ